MTPLLLQAPGIPGGPELLVLFLLVGVGVLVGAIPAYLVYRGAKSRGSTHPLAWAAMMFVSAMSFWGLFVFAVFYLVVRDDIGTAA